MRFTLISIVFAVTCVTSVADEYLMPRNLNHNNLYFDEDESEIESEVEEVKPAKQIKPVVREMARPVVKKQQVVVARKPQRRLASLDHGNLRNDGQITEEARVFRGPKETFFRLSLMGGISNIAGDDSSGDQSLRNAAGIQKNTYLGLNFDATMKNYFGLEAEGFYGLASQGTDTDGTNSAPASLQQFGGTGILKVQAPFRTGRFRIIPKLGGGYGLLSLKHQGLYGPTAGNANLSMRGIVAMAGFEIECFSTIIIGFDYMKSFGASGTYAATSLSQEEAVTNAAFDRLRVSAHYRITPSVLLGAQYQQRRIGSDFVGAGFGSPTSQEKLTQITGSIGLEF